MRLPNSPIYERHFARQIYGVFGFVLFAFAGIFLFFDLINELNRIGQSHYRVVYAAARIALLAPMRFYELMPIAALISAIYVFAVIASNAEYVIWRVSGLSARRAYWTLTKIGLPLAVMIFFTGEAVVPYAARLSERMGLEALNVSISSKFLSGIWVRDTLDNDGADRLPVRRFINVGELMPDMTIHNVRIYEFDARFRLIDIRFAQHGQFIAPHDWRLTDVRTTRLTRHPTRPERGLRMPLYSAQQSMMPEYQMHSQLTPDILAVLMVAPDQMSILNLLAYIHHLKKNRQDAQRYRIALWRKIFYPSSIWVMLALALPFAYLHTRSGGVGIKVLGGLMLGISFQLLSTLFSHIGALSMWPAPLTAALPALFYLALGFGLLRWVERHG